METNLPLDHRFQLWGVLRRMLYHRQGIMRTLDNEVLFRHSGNLGGFVRGSSPYVGHFFQQFWLFGLEDCKRKGKRMSKIQ